jgi:hypothetical protein
MKKITFLIFIGALLGGGNVYGSYAPLEAVEADDLDGGAFVPPAGIDGAVPDDAVGAVALAGAAPLDIDDDGAVNGNEYGAVEDEDDDDDDDAYGAVADID